MVISPLRRKVLRDLRRLWAQVLAIALVLAAGVATMILGNGAYASLHETRARYYDENRFADVFADVIGLAMAAAFSSDLYRVPYIVGREVYATASLIVTASALASAVAIRGRINNLDMIEVLKTRE